MYTKEPTVTDKKPVPIAWTKTYTGTEGKTSRIFTTTMGHSFDFKDEPFRKLMINACYWGMKMEDRISLRCNAELVGEYNPATIGFAGHKKGVKPSDHALK